MQPSANKMDNIGTYMLEALKLFNDEIAIVFEGMQYSGNQIASIILSTANQLLTSGVKPGDIVAIQNNNSLEHFASSISIALLGATAVSQSHTRSNEAIRKQNDLLKTQWIFASENQQPQAYQNSPKILHFQAGRTSDTFITDESVAQRPDAPWIIATGSGSTGSPKHIPITHVQQIRRCESATSWAPYSNEDTFASLANVTFYQGKNRVMESICMGTKAVLLPTNTTTKKSDLELIKTIYANPYHLNMLLKDLNINAEKTFPNLKHIIAAGGIISKELRHQVRDNLCSNLHILYGTNESCSCAIASPPDSYLDSAPVGRAMEKFEVDIVDENNIAIQSGAIGFIRIKSDCCASTYLNEDNASKKAFIDDYFFPGDRGRVDESGLLYFEGRSDGMMIFNGINIFPSEIELCLLKHPDIKDVAVTGLQHEIHGNIPTAVVSLRENSKATKESLEQFLKNNLATRVATHVILTDALPRDERGKLPKSSLEEWIINHKRQQKAHNDHQFYFFNSINGLKFKGSRTGLSVQSTSIGNKYQLKTLTKYLGVYPELGSEKIKNSQQIFLLALQTLTQSILNYSGLPPCHEPTITQLEDQKSRHLFIIHFQQFPINDKRILQFAIHLSMKIIIGQNTLKDSGNFEALIAQKIKEAGETISAKYNCIELYKAFGKSSAKLTNFAVSRKIPILFQAGGFIQFGLGAQSFTMLRSGCSADTSHGARLSKDKLLTNQWLHGLGFPTVKMKPCQNLDDAIKQFKELNTKITIKPTDGDRGEGVTTEIESVQQLKIAFNLALDHSKTKRVIIQENIPGTCHRVLIANGKFIYCVKRNPNGVFGDGYRTINELVDDANKNAKRVQKTVFLEPILAIDETAFCCLKKINLTPKSIPSIGEFIPLRPIETTKWGGIDTDCTKTIHEDNIALAAQASKKIGLSICGVDIMSNDISIPWHQNNAKIIELNYQPLIGGGEASLKTLDQFFNAMMQGKGKIPIHAVYGSANAMAKALDKQNQSAAGCTFVASIDSILSPSKCHQKLSHNTLYKNIIACLTDKDCDALIVLINSNELLKTGLPIDYLSSLEICDDRIYKETSTNEYASQEEYVVIKKYLTSLSKNQKTLIYL